MKREEGIKQVRFEKITILWKLTPWNLDEISKRFQNSNIAPSSGQSLMSGPKGQRSKYCCAFLFIQFQKSLGLFHVFVMVLHVLSFWHFLLTSLCSSLLDFIRTLKSLVTLWMVSMKTKRKPRSVERGVLRWFSFYLYMGTGGVLRRIIKVEY